MTLVFGIAAAAFLGLTVACDAYITQDAPYSGRGTETPATICFVIFILFGLATLIYPLAAVA